MEELTLFMTWKNFLLLLIAISLLSFRGAILRITSALSDVATEKLVILGLQKLAKCTKNTLDDKLINEVKKSLEKQK